MMSFSHTYNTFGMQQLIARVVRYTVAAYIDVRLFLAGKAERDLPPLRLRDVGAGDFREVGQQLFSLTQKYGGIDPSSRLLDIGCGIGRLAIPLTQFLEDGTYDGFDVSARAVRWCQRNISSRHRNFRFTHAAVRNSHYALWGSAAAMYDFPYNDSVFDCVVAYSVFTHLAFEEIENYLRQAYRTLAPEGRFVATFFLLNPASENAQQDVPGVQQFPHRFGAIALANKTDPAFAVAVREDVLRRLLERIGFRNIAILQGCWYGVQNTPTFQDLVYCIK